MCVAQPFVVCRSVVAGQNEAQPVEVIPGIVAVVPDNSAAIVGDHTLVFSTTSTCLVVNQGLTAIFVDDRRPVDEGSVTVAMSVDLPDLLILNPVGLKRLIP